MKSIPADRMQAHHRELVTPGTALKDLRVKRGWTLADVSERTGIPASTLSKVENGKTELTMDRLLRISAALEVNIADLFRTPTAERVPPERARRSITRLGELPGVKSQYGDYFYHAQDLLDKKLVPIIAEIRARSMAEFGEYHRHLGEEFLLVLEGELILHTDTYAPTQLRKGDSIYFDSTMGHAYVSAGEVPCRILMVCAPSEAIGLIESYSKAEVAVPALHPGSTERR